MKKVLLALLLMFIVTQGSIASATSKFTGIMAMALTMPNGSAKVTYSFGTNAQRMDMIMQMDKIPDQLKSTVITKASQPDQAYIINHQAKNYSIVNLKTAAENAMLLDFDSNYTLERLGTQTIKGYSCQHIMLTSTTEKLELWVTRDLGDFSTFRILQSQNPRLSNTQLAKKLSTEGIEGFPVKIVQYNDNGKYMMELVQIWPKAVPPSQFSVPAGYRKVADNQKPLEKGQKEHLKTLMEKMKKFEQ
ncbi:MAG: DUF4412 domain-containing protein [Chlorobiaceae bacterium]|jgi:hypothetical protein|nr:DUF4412 domain-containing protein [Chlorobiaceae bacterium]NTV17632.1 DUF4412 domain-containing protein [Chlorobiaceae bacterium]